VKSLPATSQQQELQSLYPKAQPKPLLKIQEDDNGIYDYGFGDSQPKVTQQYQAPQQTSQIKQQP
jgi:hypothetical protein